MDGQFIPGSWGCKVFKLLVIYELQIDTKNSKFVDDVNSLVKPPTKS